MRSTKSVKHNIFGPRGHNSTLTGGSRQQEALSHTNILLSDGVRPSIVSKHLICQADYTMAFNIAHLEESIQAKG